MGDSGRTFASISSGELAEYINTNVVATIEQDINNLKKSPEKILEFDAKVDKLLALARERLQGIGTTEEKTNLPKLEQTRRIIKEPMKKNATREEKLVIAFYCIKILKHIPQGIKHIGPASLGAFGAPLFRNQKANLYLPTSNVRRGVASTGPAWAQRALRKTNTGRAAEVSSGPAAAADEEIEEAPNGFGLPAVVPAAAAAADEEIEDAPNGFGLPANVPAAAVAPPESAAIVPFQAIKPEVEKIRRRIPDDILAYMGRRWLKWLANPVRPLRFIDILPKGVKLPARVNPEALLPILTVKFIGPAPGPRKSKRARKSKRGTKKGRKPKQLLLENAPPRLLLTNGRAGLNSPPASPRLPNVIPLWNRNRTPPASPEAAPAPGVIPLPNANRPAPPPVEEVILAVNILEGQPEAAPASPRPASPRPASPRSPPRNVTRRATGPSLKKLAIGAGALLVGLFAGGFLGKEQEEGVTPAVELRAPMSKALVRVGKVPNWGVLPRMTLRNRPYNPFFAEGALVRSNQLVLDSLGNVEEINLNTPEDIYAAEEARRVVEEKRLAKEALRAAQEARRAATAKGVVLANNRRQLNAEIGPRMNLRGLTVEMMRAKLPRMETAVTTTLKDGMAQVSIESIPEAIPGIMLPSGDTLVYFTTLGVPSVGWTGLEYVYYAVEMQFDKTTTLEEVVAQIEEITREKMGALGIVRSAAPKEIVINGNTVKISESSKHKPIITFIKPQKDEKPKDA